MGDFSSHGNYEIVIIVIFYDDEMCYRDRECDDL